MPEDNLTPENVENDANNALEHLANALAGDNASVPEATTPVQSEPFSDPNKPAFAQPVQAAEAAPEPFTQAAPQYTQPTQAYDPAAQPTQAYDPAQQAAYDPAQAQYTQPTQAYDPNQQAYGAQPGAQPYYDQPQYGQPVAPQYANGSNPGTTPMVLGILSIVFAGLVGLVLSIIGLKKSGPVLAADPNNGRAKAGKVTSIIGLVLSILAIVLGIVLIVTTMIGLSAVAENPEAFVETMEQLSSYDETGELQQDLDKLKQELGMTEDSTGSTGTEGAIGDSTDYDYGLTSVIDASTFDMKATGDMEADVRAITESVIGAAKNPTAEQKAEIDKYFVEAFERSYGGTLEQFNMTQEEYMNWAAGDFQYKIQDVMGSEDYAWADVTVEARDWNQFFDLYYDEMMAIPDEEIASLDTDEKRAAKFGEIMKHAMEGTDKVEQIVSIDATKDGDTWKVDQYSVDSLFYTLYDLY